MKTHSHNKNLQKDSSLQLSTLENYKLGILGTDGEDERGGADSPYSTLWGEPTGHSSGIPECCDSPGSGTSPSPLPADDLPPMC